MTVSRAVGVVIMTLPVRVALMRLNPVIRSGASGAQA